jgi:fluoride exporter
MAKGAGCMALWHKLAWLAALGAAGTLFRYWLDGVVQRHCGTRFPWGILVVNALGSFLFGIVWAMAEERMVITGETRFLLLTGFVGAFTTFSTFMFQTGELIQDSQWLLGFANIAVSVILGLGLLFLGIYLGRKI